MEENIGTLSISGAIAVDYPGIFNCTHCEGGDYEFSILLYSEAFAGRQLFCGVKELR